MLKLDVNNTSNTTHLRPDILISELSILYPELIETLIVEYGFHCIGCFASQFETLEEGARVHGIVDQDFEEMMSKLEKLITQPNSEQVTTTSSSLAVAA